MLRRLFSDELFVRRGRELALTVRALEVQLPLRRLLAEVDLLVGSRAAFDPADSTIQ